MVTSRPLAVVTGASSGIGFELSKVLVDEGFDLVVAAQQDRIHESAAELRERGAAVEVVQVDLATHEGTDRLAGKVKELDRPVAALALNAGRSIGGAFVDGPLDEHLLVVDLNCRSTVHLAHLLLPAMIERGEGRVLITSSIASTVPGPFQSTYNASKSFLQSFALALREELKDSGVTVTALMPGPTETEVFERAEMMDTRVGTGRKDDPELVARQAYDGMMAGDERVRGGGIGSKLQGVVGRFAPDSVKAKVFTQEAEPGTAD